MFPQVSSALGRYSESKVITIEENVPDKVGLVLLKLPTDQIVVNIFYVL